MSTTSLFIGLIGLLVGLFVIALAKPYVFKRQTISIDDFKQELTKLLPDHDFVIKQGVQSRIIVSLDGIQKAIIVIDKPKADYVMGGLPIFTTDKLKKLTPIANKIKGLTVVN